jgi:hypothetical protein
MKISKEQKIAYNLYGEYVTIFGLEIFTIKAHPEAKQAAIHAVKEVIKHQDNLIAIHDIKPGNSTSLYHRVLDILKNL